MHSGAEAFAKHKLDSNKKESYPGIIKAPLYYSTIKPATSVDEWALCYVVDS